MLRLTKVLRTRALARALPTLALGVVDTLMAAADAEAAEPKPWQFGFQPSATEVMDRLSAFHDLLLIIITLIAAFVLGLLVYVMWRFNNQRNPLPSRTSHNTVIEMLWTVVPVLILISIAIPSFKLMYYMDRVPNPEMTIKVTGHQWYWSYEYPDQGGLAFDSNIIPEDQLKAGQKRLLDVDNPLVVPADTIIRVTVTGTDVIHSWFIPSFGVQEYAIVGRLNESWMKIDRSGTYYGQCSELCGRDHAFMPINVRVVSEQAFATWLADAKKKYAVKDNARINLAAVQSGP